MQEHWSIEQYKEYQQKGNKKSKYGAVKTSVDGKPYEEIVEQARKYIQAKGGFEKFAEWGLF